MSKERTSRVDRRPAVDRSPTWPGLIASLAAGVGTAIAVGGYARPALVVATASLGLLGGGLLVYRRVGVLLGGVGLFAAVILAGVRGAPLVVVVGGVAGAVFAWDAGDNALSLGAQVGDRARSRRNELVHLAGSLTVAGVAAAGGYGVYRIATGTPSGTALLLTLVAGTLLARALSE